MATDLPTPESFAGVFTQIPLDANKPLVAYGDLGASSSYGRGLVYPDDMIPTNSLITLQGQNTANLLTDKHIPGAADVFVVNPGGGGDTTIAGSAYGNGYEINPFQTAAGDSDGKAIGQLGYQTGKYYGFVFDIVWRAAPTSGASAPKLQFYIQSQAIQDLQVALASITYPKSPITGFTYPGSFQIVVPFNPPLSIPDTFGAENDITMYMDCNTIGTFGSWVGFSSGGT